MGQKQTNQTIEDLTAYWQMHRQFDANIADLARYARVSSSRMVKPKTRKHL